MEIMKVLEQTENFAPAEQTVLTYIKNHKEDVQQMTIQDLARATYTSNATIIRVCRKLSFDGFKQFKVAFVKELESKKYSKNTVNVNQPFYLEDDTPIIINRLANLYKECIDNCIEHIDIRQINEIVTLLLSSERCFIYAIGDSQLRAKSFMNKLKKINFYPILATDNYEEIVSSYNTTIKDCALFITYSSQYDAYEKCVRILKRNQTKVIVISAKDSTALHHLCDIHLSLPSKEETENISTFYSQMSIDYVLNVLYSSIYAKNYTKNRQHKKVIDRYK